MSKVRYLTGAGNARKLRRKVPKHLLKVAGKTAWVESVGTFNTKTIKQAAHLFAVKTDGHIKTLEAQLENAFNAKPISNDNIDLTKVRAGQIANEYYQRRFDDMIEARSFSVSRYDPEFSIVLAEAGMDFEHAREDASGYHVRSGTHAIQLLRKFGLMSKSDGKIQEAELLQDMADVPNFQYLCCLIERVDETLAKQRLDAIEHGTIPKFWDRGALVGLPNGLIGSKSPENSKSIDDLVKLFLESKQGIVGFSRMSQYKIPERVLREMFGTDYLLQKVDRSACRAILGFLPTIPVYVTQQYLGLTLEQAASAFKSKTGASAGRHTEARKTLQIINRMFELAKQEGWITTNPWDGLTIHKNIENAKKHQQNKATYQPFSNQHLGKIFSHRNFDPANLTSQVKPNIPAHYYWAPILALWTGMRMNEILQLEKEDIFETDEGIFYIEVTDEVKADYGAEEFSKQIKTNNSNRRVPLHSKLVQFGFPNWVDKIDSGRLFPEAKASSGRVPSGKYSKRFTYLLKEIGVWEPRRLVFHSFRNTFNDALRRAQVSQELRDVINGWSSQHIMDSNYGDGHTIKTLHAAVEKISYPELNLDHLITAQPKTGDDAS